MAEQQGVWGIDIGQAGLKAIRLRYAEAADQVLAVAFDYVPHPKILSQPDAIPEELIPQALETFLERNDVQGDKICIGVPGQAAMVKFFTLPPVESSKVAEIVRYEAKQQIPFDLDDVVWGYQPLGGGAEESGFLVDADVCLFAMKREQVEHQMAPFMEAGVELEVIQTAQLALYNFLTYDRLGMRPGEPFEASDEYTIVLDMGADYTTLIISNGEKIWPRNVPIGGNHFTRALTKEMKLTFAKAEHLKCNATKSPDPRAVFQAMRPVFNDFVSEIQRSIGYFSSVNRDAKITKVLGVGNGFKLAGLQKFLQQNLQYDVERLEDFQSVVGDAVLGAPLFEENMLAFAVPYGLALQGLNVAPINKDMLPAEIRTARTIRRKKPWAVAAAAGMLVGMSLSVAAYANVLDSFYVDKENPEPGSWGEAVTEAEKLDSEISSYQSQYTSLTGTYNTLDQDADKLVRPMETREHWLEVYKAINESLPRDVGRQKDEEDPSKRNRIRLDVIRADKQASLADWYNGLEAGDKIYLAPEDKEKVPEGSGYVFTLKGVHYHHEKDPKMQAELYVKNTFLKHLQQWQVQQPGSPAVAVRQLGITHPVIISSRTQTGVYDPTAKNPRTMVRGLGGGSTFDMSDYEGYDESSEEYGDDYGDDPGYGTGDFNEYDESGVNAQPDITFDDLNNLIDGAEDEDAPTLMQVYRTEFIIQFCWVPTPKEDRLEEPPTTEEGTDTTTPLE